MKTYLSIDIGTSSTKLSLYDESGSLLVSRSSSYAVEYPYPDWAEQDPQEWWRAVCALAPGILHDAGEETLTAVSVSGQTPLCAPVDAQGNPLRKAILWLDRRATAQVDWLRSHLGEARCRAVSLNRLDSYFGGVKWLWFRQEEPRLFSRTWKILQATSFITLKLTEKVVIDPSQAGLCSPCFNIHTCSWDGSICAEMGLPLEMLPDIHPSAALVGQVTHAAAAESGLPEGAPVVCGGGDFACSCLSTGIAGRGQAALMLGTAGNLLFPGAENRDPRLLHTIHLTGEPLPFGGVLAGTNLNWFASLLGNFGPDVFNQLDAEATRVPAGSQGLVYLPYLLGERTPIWDPFARGAFIGLNTVHSRAHLYRAVLEGVAFAFRQIAEIAAPGGIPELAPGGIIAIDGGARSALWRSILASVIGIPVIEGGSRSGTALGSAFLAAIGSGNARSFADLSEWTETGSLAAPSPADQRIYDHLYRVFSGLYEKLQPDFKALASGPAGS